MSSSHFKMCCYQMRRCDSNHNVAPIASLALGSCVLAIIPIEWPDPITEFTILCHFPTVHFVLDLVILCHKRSTRERERERERGGELRGGNVFDMKGWSSACGLRQ